MRVKLTILQSIHMISGCKSAQSHSGLQASCKPHSWFGENSNLTLKCSLTHDVTCPVSLLKHMFCRQGTLPTGILYNVEKMCTPQQEGCDGSQYSTFDTIIH